MAGDAVIVLDGDGRVLDANAATIALFGRAPILDEADLLGRLDADPDVALRPTGARRPQPIRIRSASERWAVITVHTLSDLGLGRPIRIVVARDVTLDLERRRVREAFASVVSHELRTPVTTIYGGVQLIADPEVNPTTRTEALRAVASEADRLYRLVEDLVVLARFDEPIAAGDEPLLLQRFLPSLIDEEARRSEVAVDSGIPDDLPAVVGRPGYVEQVMRHLVITAIRLTPKDRNVVVSATPNGANVDVNVLDGGPPVESGEAKLLFDLFHRSSRTTADASGANVSLFVCRRLIEAMRGRIWARSRPGLQGVQVGFSLHVATGD
jgi:K+-sensing histidine kinase KdpD